MKYKLTIEGMHCASCASNVERALKKLGIKEVSVSVLTKKAFFEADEKLEEQIKKSIEKIGYKISSMEKT